jgi:hypothetical protein
VNLGIDWFIHLHLFLETSSTLLLLLSCCSDTVAFFLPFLPPFFPSFLLSFLSSLSFSPSSSFSRILCLVMTLTGVVIFILGTRTFHEIENVN